MKGAFAILLLILSPLALGQTYCGSCWAGMGLAQASILDHLGSFIPPGNQWIAWSIGGILAGGAISLLANIAAGAVALIPGMGWLAFVIKFIAGQYQKWLADQLPKMAEQAWLTTESLAATAKKEGVTATSEEKKQAALTILKKQAPEGRMSDLEAALEAAHARAKASGFELTE